MTISHHLVKSILFSESKILLLPHENYGDWELRGPCRENCTIYGKPHDYYRISPKSVNITRYPHDRENLQTPYIAL